MATVPSPDAVRSQCGRILASPSFADSPRLSRFLRYVVDRTLKGHEETIKEYAIGVDVFERPPDFDPKIDPIVRVYAGRLRLKLIEYYDGPGRGDEWRIDVPKGGYVPAFRINATTDRPSSCDVSQLDPIAAKRPIALDVRKESGRSGTKHGEIRWLAWVGAAALATAAGIFRAVHPAAPLRVSNLMRLTAGTGHIEWHTVSPDGKFLAYSSDEGGTGQPGLIIRQLDSGAIIHPEVGEGYVSNVSFSPDSGLLALSLHPPAPPDQHASPPPGLYIMPALGGPKRKLLDNGWAPRFSPDGKWVAFVRPGARFSLYIVSADGGEPKQLAANFEEARTPQWAADSSHVLFLGQEKGKGSRLERLDWFVTTIDGMQPVRTGAYTRLLNHAIDPNRPVSIRPGPWYRGSVVFSVRDGEAVNLWSVPISSRTWKVSGDPVRLTFGTAQEVGPEVSREGRLVFSAVRFTHNLYFFSGRTRNSAEGGPQRFTSNSVHNWEQSVSRDGRTLAYVSNRSGDWEIWKRDLASEKEEVIYRSVTPLRARISPDGADVAFAEVPALASAKDIGLKIVSIAGGPARSLCSGCGSPVDWTPDGRAIVLDARGSESQNDRRAALIDIVTGRVRELVRIPGTPVIPRSLAPDGRRLAVQLGDDRNGVIAVVPLAEGVSAPREQWIEIGRSVRNPAWSSDGSTLYLASFTDGHDCLWGWPLRSGTGAGKGNIFPVRHFHDPSFQLDLGLGRFLTPLREGFIATILQTAPTEIWSAQLQ